jgi:hypothetical protein
MPEIFSHPSGPPDVRFKIFGKYELHAHSWILKKHSEYFEKRLDPCDGDPTAAVLKAQREAEVGQSPDFRYEWVSCIDQDGSWCVSSAASLVVEVRNPN